MTSHNPTLRKSLLDRLEDEEFRLLQERSRLWQEMVGPHQQRYNEATCEIYERERRIKRIIERRYGR